MSDQMDLLVEQVKMLAGEIAFSTSNLKRLVEQSTNDPDSSKTQVKFLFIILRFMLRFYMVHKFSTVKTFLMQNMPIPFLNNVAQSYVFYEIIFFIFPIILRKQNLFSLSIDLRE